MTIVFLILQIVLSCGLVALILIQSKGGGLGSVFGGSGSYSTRRGVEVIVFRLTIVIAVLFFLISAFRLFV